MYAAFSPTRRNRIKEQQLPRTTRQMDMKKRNTNNSSNDKLLVSLETNTNIKKKQKLDDNKEEVTAGSNNNTFLQNHLQTKNVTNTAVAEEIFSNTSVNLESNPDNFFLDKENISDISNDKKESKTYTVSNNDNNILGEAHISLLHSYTRDFLFKKIKIITHNHLEMNGFIMQNVFEKLKLSNNFQGNSIALANACRTEIRKTICSRRGYVKRQIGLQITEFHKSGEKQMFDVDLMNNFYKPEFEKDGKTINAWYIYVMFFLPLVSKKWRNFVTTEKLELATSMFKAISISDEAIVQWFIILWNPIIKAQKEKNWVLEKKEKRKGPHDSKHNIPLYSKLHIEIEMKRKHHLNAVKWNELFWNEVKKRNKDQLDQLETKKKSKYSETQSTKNLIPLPGINDDEEFLMAFTMEYDAAKTLKSLSPQKNKCHSDKSDKESDDSLNENESLNEKESVKPVKV